MGGRLKRAAVDLLGWPVREITRQTGGGLLTPPAEEPEPLLPEQMTPEQLRELYAFGISPEMAQGRPAGLKERLYRFGRMVQTSALMHPPLGARPPLRPEVITPEAQRGSGPTHVGGIIDVTPSVGHAQRKPIVTPTVESGGTVTPSPVTIGQAQTLPVPSPTLGTSGSLTIRPPTPEQARTVSMTPPVVGVARTRPYPERAIVPAPEPLPSAGVPTPTPSPVLPPFPETGVTAPATARGSPHLPRPHLCIRRFRNG